MIFYYLFFLTEELSVWKPTPPIQPWKCSFCSLQLRLLFFAFELDKDFCSVDGHQSKAHRK